MRLAALRRGMGVVRISSLAFSLFFCVAAVTGAEWVMEEDYRWRSLQVEGGAAGFDRLLADRTGIAFTNRLQALAAAKNQIRMNGSGVALGDVDGDGWCDIYLCRLEGDNVLYRNLGDWKFQEVAGKAGVACPEQYSTGVLLADLEGDGDLDLLVSSIGGGVRAFLNRGDGTFEEQKIGLREKGGAMSMAMADVDQDGDLDLYVTFYRTTTMRSTGMAVLNINGRHVLRAQDRDGYELTPEGKLLEHGEVDALYLNRGNGTFIEEPWTGGRFLDEKGIALKEPPRDWGLSVLLRDVTGDGWPDIYVCNDFHSPDRIWVNRQGVFQAIAPEAIRHTSTFSMGVDGGDVNGDGVEDWLVLDMLDPDHGRRMRQMSTEFWSPELAEPLSRPQFDRNTLQLGRGDGTFAEVGRAFGVAATGWSWAAVLMDVDLDGWQDLLVTTGHLFDSQDLDAAARVDARGPFRQSDIWKKLLYYPPLELPNVAMANIGGRRFEDRSEAWGLNWAGISHGAAVANLDNDGDLDVVVNNLNQEAAILQNRSGAGRVAVRVKGRGKNPRAIGARIEVHGTGPLQSRVVQAGGRYLSGDDTLQVFAVEPGGMRMELVWPDGTRKVLEGVEGDRLYEVLQPEEGARFGQEGDGSVAGRRQERPRVRFKDASGRIDHRHGETPFDDFGRQPMLPRSGAHWGPGVAWFDWNGDGRDDLVIGAGRGGRMALFENEGEGRFRAVEERLLDNVMRRDQTGVLGWHIGGKAMIAAGSSNYEDGLPTGAPVRFYDFGQGTMDETLDGQLSSAGPLAMADVDRDGDLDLFVGGRVLPGRYPAAAEQSLYRWEQGRFARDVTADFRGAGLVSGAMFCDVNGDQWPDLLLATEWGPIRLFLNVRGRLWEATDEWGLASLSGFWTGIAAGDFDNDGRLDLVAGNWGINTSYSSARETVVVFGDFDGNGRTELVEAESDGRGGYWPKRPLDTLARGWPVLRQAASSYQAFGKMDLARLLKETGVEHQQLSVNHLQSTLFLNRGDHFEAVALPWEAQWAPVFALVVGDFNNDGNEDLVLGQNFFHSAPDYGREDAGRGLVLLGDGRGGFDAVDGAESGLIIYGDARAGAAADFDGDGLTDLVMTQNNGRTLLFRNMSDGAGESVRIRLRGDAHNSGAIGARVRLTGEGKSGPVREIQAGSGYWSQNSAEQVLGLGEGKTHVEILWSNGREQQAAITDEQLVLEQPGQE